jgi:pyruvate dehydrogenase E1 component beta subunit/2-oxoisovalerate dehydrogenase E1 component beta subunit
MESLYAHYPGVIVVTPATVADAYFMLLEAIKLNDPVIFCEHKFLYYHLKADALPEPSAALPIGKARIARSGKHATVVTYSAMLHESLRAAEELARDGYEIEVVDLRTIKPLDTDTVLGSVARTGRLLVVSEDFPFGGVCGEVVSRVVADGFHLLDAPPRRLNAKDTPIPYHPNLWATHRPTATTISSALRELLAC